MARVLVVDDEPAVRRALERALRLENYEVGLAADGEEALDALAGEPADAVILDVAMPQARRPRGLPAAAPGRRPHAGADAHRPRRDRRSRRRPGRRRRRLPRQAVRAARAAGPAARAAAPRQRRGGRGRGPALRRPGARPGRPRGAPRRAPDRALADRVPAARAVPAPPAPGADALDDLRERLGLRLRPDLQRARRVHGLSAPQDRGRAASRGCCTPCAASATCCATRIAAGCRCAAGSRLVAAAAVGGRRRAGRAGLSTAWSAASCAARSTTRCGPRPPRRSDRGPRTPWQRPFPGSRASAGGPAPYAQIVLANGRLARVRRRPARCRSTPRRSRRSPRADGRS